ncbi:hypothetical protein [Yinghuangia soli]|uniref:Barstar (barnase inhibitor) domain-containing protein n=1 Tax=Yinghuangia soli TaxID=2908204 RepID=A0AA41U113_9ACTN|nr:hypothetical protein [Yinghuangia soli]MCF2525674.1 hypothetical protein [Yinghuangia soli]
MTSGRGIVLTRDEDDSLLAECAEIDGLFAPDREPDPRPRVTLLGCSAAGAIRRALGSDTARHSLMAVYPGRSGAAADAEWFEDVRLVGDVPCARDLSLRDMTFDYEETSGRYPAEMWGVTSSSRIPQVFVDEGKAAVAGFRDVAWLQPYLEPPERTITLVGCVPQGALATAIRVTSRRRRQLGLVYFEFRDTAGTDAFAFGAGVEVLGARPTRLAGDGPPEGRRGGRRDGLVDVDLRVLWDALPRAAVRPVWDSWLTGPPETSGTWIPYDARGRQAWLDFAGHRRREEDCTGPPRGTVVELDGTHLTDTAAFFCAFGEAVRGPGGCVTPYFGSLHEYVREPFTLVWSRADVARQAWAADDPSVFGRLLDDAARAGIDVVLR